jgi:hypothetical protein
MTARSTRGLPDEYSADDKRQRDCGQTSVRQTVAQGSVWVERWAGDAGWDGDVQGAQSAAVRRTGPEKKSDTASSDGHGELLLPACLPVCRAGGRSAHGQHRRLWYSYSCSQSSRSLALTLRLYLCLYWRRGLLSALPLLGELSMAPAVPRSFRRRQPITGRDSSWECTPAAKLSSLSPAQPAVVCLHLHLRLRLRLCLCPVCPYKAALPPLVACSLGRLSSTLPVRARPRLQNNAEVH